MTKVNEVALQCAAREANLQRCRATWTHPQEGQSEQRRRLALDAQRCLAEADLIALRLRALGRDASHVEEALDLAFAEIVSATVEALR